MPLSMSTPILKEDHECCKKQKAREVATLHDSSAKPGLAQTKRVAPKEPEKGRNEPRTTKARGSEKGACLKSTLVVPQFPQDFILNNQQPHCDFLGFPTFLAPKTHQSKQLQRPPTRIGNIFTGRSQFRPEVLSQNGKNTHPRQFPKKLKLPLLKKTPTKTAAAATHRKHFHWKDLNFPLLGSFVKEANQHPSEHFHWEIRSFKTFLSPNKPQKYQLVTQKKPTRFPPKHEKIVEDQLVDSSHEVFRQRLALGRVLTGFGGFPCLRGGSWELWGLSPDSNKNFFWGCFFL